MERKKAYNGEYLGDLLRPLHQRDAGARRAIQGVREQGVQIVGIVIDVLTSQGISDSQVDLAKDIVAQTSADYTHLLPSGDLIAAKLKDVSSVPETVFLDENGKQVGTSFLGARSAEEWRAVIDGLLKEVS